MKLASHNSMTYLKPKHWYMYPFRFIAKCQSKTIREQYRAGARLFDIRIGFDKENNPVFKHGLMTFKIDNIYRIFDFLCSKNDVIIRIVNEDNHSLFLKFCRELEEIYGDKFCGGYVKSTWEKVFTFWNEDKYHYTLEENYASMPSNPKWYGIWPWLYCKLKKRKKYSDKEYLMIDFI